MKIKIFQKGFNYSQDGPGNRLVYHLQGCNMHCPWCSNPEGISINNPNAQTLHINEILSQTKKAESLFFDGGGVTFTGGEATVQIEAIAALLKLLKQSNINTALETNGTSQKLPELLPLLDTIMIDFKHYDKSKLKAVTGGDITAILENLAYIKQSGIAAIVRIPLIKQFNAQPDDARKFAYQLSALAACNINFELLPYHEYGKDKWAKCGMEYTVKDQHVTAEQVKIFSDIFKENGMNVIKT